MSLRVLMLIGAELFWRLICAGQIKQSKRQPIIQKTHFGWIVSGHTLTKHSKITPALTCHVATTDDLKGALTRFWDVEHDISLSSNLSPEEQDCESIFRATTKRNHEGRFIVQLPTKPDKLANLGFSKDVATRRFMALERRLFSQPKLRAQYNDFIQDYRDLGNMHEVIDDQDIEQSNAGTPCYYLPHHAVFKETRTTTKLRVVFDGSCKTSTGISLNEALMGLHFKMIYSPY